MARRPGRTYPLYDFGPLTISALGNWKCDGSHRWPKLDLILRDRWLAGPACSGRGRALKYRRLSIPLPWVHWRWQYRWPILKPIHNVLHKLYWDWSHPKAEG